MEDTNNLNSIFAILGLNSSLIYWFIAFLIGTVAALAELLSRYSDGFKILTVRESYLYFAFNGFASLFAYWFMLSYNIDFGPLTKSEIGKVLTAGLSAMVILRSSFASIKNGDKTWDAGLAPILHIFLNAADRAFDQSRSKMTIKEVGIIMNGVDFNMANKSLPLLCFSAMQNLSKEEQETAAAEIISISDESYSAEVKSLHLGIILSRYTGITLLEAIVSEFKNLSTKELINVNSANDDTLAAQQEKIKAMKNSLFSNIDEKDE